MPRLFIGQNGFYPSWARTQGRWVLQRVFTTVIGLDQQLDEISRPDISFESLLWIPPKVNFKRAFLRSVNEGSIALAELHYIPLICSRCNGGWVHPRILITDESIGPEGWRLRCPEHSCLVGPDVQPLRRDVMIQRWLSIGRPLLDNPSAATSIKSVGPVINLEEWIHRFQPMDLELAYVGQQLWPTFSEFIQSCHPTFAGSNAEDTKPTN